MTLFICTEIQKESCVWLRACEFPSHEQALLGLQRLQRLEEWKVPSCKVLAVFLNSPHQGPDAHIKSPYYLMLDLIFVLQACLSLSRFFDFAEFARSLRFRSDVFFWRQVLPDCRH